MRKLSGKPAQIMVIVLLILSVLSIIALTITMATIKDSQEQIQNKQYQQYYSVGEKVILDVQRTIGSNPLTNINELNVDGDATQNLPIASCTGDATKKNCNFFAVNSTEVTQNSAEKFDVYVEIEDSTEIKDQVIQENQCISLDLANVGNNETIVTWPDDNVNIDWNVSFDFYYAPPANPTATEFLTKKLVYTAGTGSNHLYANVANTDDPCFNITGSGNSMTITTKTSATCTGLQRPLYLRFRPVGGDATISVKRTDGSIPLQRTLRAVTTSSNQVTNTANTQNPTSVLQTTYLLTKNPFCLLDYVLRTEQGITKNQ